MGQKQAESKKRLAVQSITIVKSSGNVYADLGLPDPEGMLRKAKIVTKLNKLIKLKGLTRSQAGKLLGFPEIKLAAILRGRFDNVSERRLMDCLTRLATVSRLS